MKKICLIFSLIILSKSTYAYLDPGTGGTIIGSLWPLIIIIFSTIGAFLVKYFWKPIKRLPSKFKKRRY